MKRNIILSIIIICMCFTIGCSSSSAEKKEVEKTSAWGNSLEDLGIPINPCYSIDQWSILSNGIFYCSQDLLKFYDYASEESYVLCGSINCKHDSEDCPAWVSRDTKMFGASIYNDKLYYFLEDNVSMRLMSQNITGDQQHIIWKKDHTDISSESFSLTSISNLIYHRGYVWGEFEFDALSQDLENTVVTSLVAGINLETGSMVEITRIPDLADIKNGKECYGSVISYIGNGVVITDTYSSYISTDIMPKETYMLYDTETAQNKIIHETVKVPMVNENTIVGSVPEIEFLGEFAGKYVCSINTEENMENRANNKALYLYDTDMDSFELLIDGLYGFPFFEARSILDSLIDESHIMAAVLEEDEETVDVICYNLADRSYDLSFKDTKSLTYRMFDKLEGQVIIKVYSSNSNNNKYHSYRMSIDDYKCGLFDNMTEMKVE